MATGKNGNGARLNGRAARSTTVRSDSRSRRRVRVAILGVGNCASSLVQGVEYYRDAKPGASIPGLTDDYVGILKATRTDVVVNYLPVGSEEAVKWYAEQVLEAGCAFVNCMPVFLAREPYWRGRFEKRGIPIIGDDIKSQVGATIVHRVLTRLFEDRGVKLERTYH